MGINAFVEPLVVILLLVGGSWINRTASPHHMTLSGKDGVDPCGDWLDEDLETGRRSPAATRPSLLNVQNSVDGVYRTRQIHILGLRKEVLTPNTAIYRHSILSRLLQKFPFLVECWYWALIYWIYQLGRAATAVTLQQGTVHVARHHALQLVHLEQRLQVFWEPSIQKFFLRHPTLIGLINDIYSFIHIPGTILFLVWLYYYTTTCNRPVLRERDNSDTRKPMGGLIPDRLVSWTAGCPDGPSLYEARRRTMGICNLFAFVIFTLWPCMPPRLLSDKSITGPTGEEARSIGFVDTVHGSGGQGSVWTENRFCNQYAAMPSLHFGYSLMIGLTIMTVPLAPKHASSRRLRLFRRLRLVGGLSVPIPTPLRLFCITIGILYPAIILVAVIATANHFILDAVAGACVCVLGWKTNRLLLNLLPFEDYFLSILRIHKPAKWTMNDSGGSDDQGAS